MRDWTCCRQKSGWSGAVLIAVVFTMALGAGVPSHAATPPARVRKLASLPPMGWNDWAHYQCGFTAATILENARALLQTGLAARGYNTVTIDDCWMLKNRDAAGNLQPDPQRFPHGMKAVANAIHGMGLKFGIYEDAGYATCGGFAGSGVPKGGGKDHFVQDAKLFASWGVDYLKLDGCNVDVPAGGSNEAAYRRAYDAESAALRSVHRPIVFSESAPAYFQGTPQWYDVLRWVKLDGQLWREGSDIATFDEKKPDAERFGSVLWNYAYNLPLARFQEPGNWNDADFIIGGDRGMSLAETRSQVALWSMMSAPLILSSEVSRISQAALAVLENRRVIAVDQDRLGREATLVQRSADIDLLVKRLSGGDVAVALLNRSAKPVTVALGSAELGFAARSGCSFAAQDLWSGRQDRGISELRAEVAPHDTAIWRLHPGTGCGALMRTGAIVLTANDSRHPDGFSGYTRCLSATGKVEACAGTAAERWTVTAAGAITSGSQCLAAANGQVVMQHCSKSTAEHWNYTLEGNLTNEGGRCLTAATGMQKLTVEACGQNREDQIWSLPE